MRTAATPVNEASVTSSSRSSAALLSEAIGLVVSSATTAPTTSSPLQIGCAADITTARPSWVRRVRVAGVPCKAAPTSPPPVRTSSGRASAKSSVGRCTSQPTSGCHHGDSEAASAGRFSVPARARTCRSRFTIQMREEVRCTPARIAAISASSRAGAAASRCGRSCSAVATARAVARSVCSWPSRRKRSTSFTYSAPAHGRASMTSATNASFVRRLTRTRFMLSGASDLPPSHTFHRLIPSTVLDLPPVPHAVRGIYGVERRIGREEFTAYALDVGSHGAVVDHEVRLAHELLAAFHVLGKFGEGVDHPELGQRERYGRAAPRHAEALEVQHELPALHALLSGSRLGS